MHSLVHCVKLTPVLLRPYVCSAAAVLEFGMHPAKHYLPVSTGGSSTVHASPCLWQLHKLVENLTPCVVNRVVAKDELDNMLSHQQLGKRIPLLFLANKMDLPSALTPSELAQV